MIKKNLKPDKQNYEYAGLISRWTDLKVGNLGRGIYLMEKERQFMNTSKNLKKIRISIKPKNNS